MGVSKSQQPVSAKQAGRHSEVAWLRRTAGWLRRSIRHKSLLRLTSTYKVRRQLSAGTRRPDLVAETSGSDGMKIHNGNVRVPLVACVLLGAMAAGSAWSQETPPAQAEK